MRIGGGAAVNTHRSCEVAASDSRFGPLAALTAEGEPQRARFARRFLEIAGWIVPGAILALMPKCPACLAAYVAIATGVGLSLTAATHLRALLLVLCIALLLYPVVRRLGGFLIVKEALLRVKGHLSAILTKENQL
jgi:hypothetical protein